MKRTSSTTSLKNPNERLQQETEERERVEEELRAAREYAQNIIDSSLDMIISTDEHRRVVEFNQAAERTFGYSKAEVIGKKVDFLYADPSEGLRVREAVRRTGRFTGEITDRRKNGQTFPSLLAASALWDADGTFLGLMGISRDITEHKRAEEALRHQERYFRSLIENSTDATTILSREGNVLYHSPSFERLLGHRPEDRHGKSMLDNVHPEDRPRVGEAFAQLLARPGDDFPPIEVSVQHSDGSWRTIELIATNLLDHPSVNGVVVNFRDITQRKESEKRLQESEEKWRSLAANIPNILAIVGRDHRVEFINRAVEGLDIQDVTGRNTYDFMAPEYVDEVRRVTEKVLDSGEPATYETRGVGPDGSLSWYETQVGPIKLGGQVVATTHVISDVTERKQAQKALSEREEWFRGIYEESPISIALYDSNGEMFDANKACLDTFGVHNVAELMAPRLLDDPLISNEHKQMLREGKVVRYEIRHHFDKGWRSDPNTSPELGYIDIDVLITPLGLQETGSLRGYLLQVQDITERNRAKEELQWAYEQEKSLREQLELEAKRRVEFLRAMAHELKTPVTSMMASSELMTLELSEGPLLSLSRNINRSANKLDKRIDELLDLARGEMDMIKLFPQSVEPLQLIRRVFDDIFPLIADGGHALAPELPLSLPKIWADEGRLEQVLLNLISNASKFMRQPGKITLGAREEPGNLVMEVHDTGPGINREAQGRLFDPYYRLIDDRDHMHGLGNCQLLVGAIPGQRSCY